MSSLYPKYLLMGFGFITSSFGLSPHAFAQPTADLGKADPLYSVVPDAADPVVAAEKLRDANLRGAHTDTGVDAPESRVPIDASSDTPAAGAYTPSPIALGPFAKGKIVETISPPSLGLTLWELEKLQSMRKLAPRALRLHPAVKVEPHITIEHGPPDLTTGERAKIDRARGEDTRK